VDNIAILGDAAGCRAKLDRFRRNGADLLIIAFPHGSPLTAIQRTIDALAPEPAGALDPVR